MTYLEEHLGALRRTLASGDVTTVEQSLLRLDKLCDEQDLVDALRRIYVGLNLMPELDGFRIPYAVFEAPVRQRGKPDSLLVLPLEDQPSARFINHVTDYHLLLKEISVKRHMRDPGVRIPWNGPKFGMRELVTSDSLSMSCYRTMYFDMLDTSDCLTLEIALALSRDRRSVECLNELLDPKHTSLPLRARLHGAVDCPALEGHRRAAGIAVATLLCYFSEGQYRCVLIRRSERKVAIKVPRLDVIPSAMFEPSNLAGDEPFSIVENVYREYVEEVHGHPDCDGVDAYWYKHTEAFQLLDTLIKRGDAMVYLAGVAIDLYCLRPVVCTVLFVSDPEWPQRVFNTKNQSVGWEYAMAHSDDQRGQLLPVTDFERVVEQYPALFLPGCVAPWALACLWLGLPVAKSLAQNQPSQTGAGIRECVWVHILESGRENLPTRGVNADTVRTPQRNDYDLIVDERTRTLLIKNKPEVSTLDDVAKFRNLAFIFTALTNVGKDVRRRTWYDNLAIARGAPERMRDLLNQDRRRLANCISKELRDAMFVSRRVTGCPYSIPATGWSFSWARTSESPDINRWR